MNSIDISKLKGLNKKELLDYIEEKFYKDLGIIWEKQELEEEKVKTLLEKKSIILKEEKNKEIQTDNKKPTNILIEGDNYHALSVLQYTHQGEIDVIYIDPPYNTGNEDFEYNDKFVNLDDKWRHSKWLAFMEKRLQLAKKLLKDNGLIFISIDDNEQAQLKLLCDEVFIERNFVNVIAIKSSESTGVKMAHTAKKLPKLKEYVLFYKKKEIQLNPVTIPKEDWDNEYNRLILGVSQSEITKLKSIMEKESTTTAEIKQADKICSKISLDNVTKLFKKGISKQEEDDILFQNAWRIVRTVSVEGGAKKIADKKRKQSKSKFFLIVTPENKKYLILRDYDPKLKGPRIKLLFADDYLTVNVGDFWSDIKTTGLGNEGGVEFENGKKPLKLLKRILQTSTAKNGLILDFFAGSGTTGHAVLELNKEDGGNRKFILCTNNEKKIAAKKCYTRINQAMKGYKKSKSQKIKGLGGNLKYYKIDFENREDNHNQIKKFAKISTEILCLKEDCFELIEKKKDFSAFGNASGKRMCIIYNYPAIKSCINYINEIKRTIPDGEKINVYEFSSESNETHADEFDKKGILDLVNLYSFPNEILRTYERVLKND